MKQLKHFVENEFIDESEENWFNRMSLKQLALLDQLREETGYTILIKKTVGAIGRNSGGTSQHVCSSNKWKEVRATDVSVFTSGGKPLNRLQADNFVKSAKRVGFTGIGVYPFWGTPGFHLDTRWNKPAGSPAQWADIGKYPEHNYVAIELGLENWPE